VTRLLKSQNSGLGSRGISIVGSRYLAKPNEDLVLAVVIGGLQINEGVMITYSYELQLFKTSSHQSKFCCLDINTREYVIITGRTHHVSITNVVGR
jgi:hypothetical protein